MRTKLFTLLLLAAIAVLPAFSQKILLKINSITDPEGEEVRALDFRITSPVVLSGGGGTGVSKATAADLIIKKTEGASTSDFFKKIVQSTTYPLVVFEYYNAANELYYTITLKDAKLTQLFWLSPECPSCLKLEHQVGFVFAQYTTEDKVTGKILTWNIPANTIQ